MPQMSQVLREHAIGMLTAGISTKDFAVGGNKCFNSPVVTFAEVSDLWQFDDKAFSPVLWLPDLAKEISQHLGNRVVISFK